MVRGQRGQPCAIRIVLAGFDTEHAALEDSRVALGRMVPRRIPPGGMGSLGKGNGTSSTAERLWLSPHCLGAKVTPQMDLFA